MVISTGYFIVDPHSPKGRMRVQPYLYKLGAEDDPLFELSQESDTQWFATYKNQFEVAWNDAKVFRVL
jgi:hypothetical protein